MIIYTISFHYSILCILFVFKWSNISTTTGSVIVFFMHFLIWLHCVIRFKRQTMNKKCMFHHMDLYWFNWVSTGWSLDRPGCSSSCVYTEWTWFNPVITADCEEILRLMYSITLIVEYFVNFYIITPIFYILVIIFIVFIYFFK